MTMIPYGRQSINQSDIDAVLQVLHSDWLTQGPVVPRFEQQLADYCGAAHGVAVSSATAALHLACLSLGLGHGDTLWTSPNTFVASANAARFCGALVDFVDIDPTTYNISIDALRQKLRSAQQANALPKIVMPVHFAGNPCDMAAIAALADEYGFSVIEDASHAVGAEYQQTKIGACRYSDATVFSFHPVKLMTTGEGGMLLTNSGAIREKAARLRSHGVTRDLDGGHGDWEYRQLELGFNYRMTDMQAALGCSQLQRLDDFVARRHELVARYRQLLQHPSIALPETTEGAYSSWHLYVIRLLDGIDRKRVFERMRESGVGVNVHYIPVHTQPYYQRLGFHEGDFPQAERYYSEALTLPLFPDLTDEQQEYVVEQLLQAIS